MVGNKMKIGIFGDSFTDLAPKDKISDTTMPWMLWVEKLSEHKITTFGKSGTSIWFSYKRFLKNFKDFDAIVFSYSSHDRWFNINGAEGLSYIISKEQAHFSRNEDKDLLELLIKVWPYLHDQQLNIFMFQHVFNSVNKLCKEYNKKIINIFNYEEIFDKKISIDISENFGSVLTNLCSIANKETQMNKRFREMVLTNIDFRFCHLNIHNNKVLASIILESLNEKKPHFNLMKDNRWSYDAEHLEIYLKK